MILCSYKLYWFVLCEFSDSHSGEYEEGSLLVMALCSLMNVEQRFRGTYCLHYQCDEYAAHEDLDRDMGTGQIRQTLTTPLGKWGVRESKVANGRRGQTNISNWHFMQGLLSALTMEAVSASEMSLCFYKITQRHIPEACHLQYFF
jgi:hypothetical protein